MHKHNKKAGVMNVATGRQDAWTAEEDRLLAEIVLEHIRTGSTQLKAFEEVGGRLSRTAAACGFRWNSFVRKKYKEDIQAAKEERKKKPRQGKKEESRQTEPEWRKKQVSTQDIIQFLLEMEEAKSNIRPQMDAGEQIVLENRKLKEKLAETEEKLERIKNEYHRLKADYEQLLEILEKAREVAAADRADQRQKAKAES
jgi:RsfA family transcription factor